MEHWILSAKPCVIPSALNSTGQEALTGHLGPTSGNNMFQTFFINLHLGGGGRKGEEKGEKYHEK